MSDFIEIPIWPRDTSAVPIESHEIAVATEPGPCCRCAEPIAAGETVHTVTVTEGGKVTHRQATHLRHLRA